MGSLRTYRDVGVPERRFKIQGLGLELPHNHLSSGEAQFWFAPRSSHKAPKPKDKV